MLELELDELELLELSLAIEAGAGTGKTSTARILAKALNCSQGPASEPCLACDPCREIAEGRDMDVLEIDGASNTGNFGETMNLAALWTLPVLFLVENNLYGMGTAIERHSAGNILPAFSFTGSAFKG